MRTETTMVLLCALLACGCETTSGAAGGRFEGAIENGFSGLSHPNSVALSLLCETQEELLAGVLRGCETTEAAGFAMGPSSRYILTNYHVVDTHAEGEVQSLAIVFHRDGAREQAVLVPLEEVRVIAHPSVPEGVNYNALSTEVVDLALIELPSRLHHLLALDGKPVEGLQNIRFADARSNYRQRKGLRGFLSNLFRRPREEKLYWVDGTQMDGEYAFAEEDGEGAVTGVVTFGDNSDVYLETFAEVTGGLDTCIGSPTVIEKGDSGGPIYEQSGTHEAVLHGISATHACVPGTALHVVTLPRAQREQLLDPEVLSLAFPNTDPSALSAIAELVKQSVQVEDTWPSLFAYLDEQKQRSHDELAQVAFTAYRAVRLDRDAQWFGEGTVDWIETLTSQ